jgi:UDP-N-acetylglucosamine:LPS N-acetylglucosamine transferase
MSKKVLIVYEKMGMGHLRMAKILEDVLQGEDAEVVIMAESEMVGSTSVNSVVWFWNFCIKKNLIKTVDILLNFLARILMLPFVEVSSAGPLHKKLEEINPDIVISTVDGLNKVVGTYAKEKGIPFYIFITEVSTFIDLVNPYATHLCYFKETGEAVQSYDFNNTYYSFKLTKDTTLFEKIQYIFGCYKDFAFQAYKNSIFRNPDRRLKKQNDAKFRMIGPLAEKKHFTEKDIQNTRVKYGFDNGRDNVVLASGSIGGKLLIKMVELICRDYKKPINLIAVCGRDEAIYEEISKFKATNPNIDINLMPFKYIENFDEILSAADCLIGRPSAGIFIESLLNKTPEITFRKATSNDKGTLTMIEKYNIGKVVEKNSQVAAALEDILSKKNYYKNNIEKLLSHYCTTYEDKKEFLKEVILHDESYKYMTDEDFGAEVNFNTSVSN